MDRTRYIKIAAATRNSRARALSAHASTQVLHSIAGICGKTEERLSKLTAEERGLLLTTLTAMLKRERRRCRARAGRYDAGRHIGLYMAVKFLTENKKPGA